MRAAEFQWEGNKKSHEDKHKPMVRKSFLKTSSFQKNLARKGYQY